MCGLDAAGWETGWEGADVETSPVEGVSVICSGATVEETTVLDVQARCFFLGRASGSEEFGRRSTWMGPGGSFMVGAVDDAGVGETPGPGP